jgi:hypothetical protein
LTLNPRTLAPLALCLALAAPVLTPSLAAQSPLLTTSSSATLPVAPDAIKAPPGAVGNPIRPASTTDKYIAPGQPAPRLDVRDKFELGFKLSVSPLSMLGWAASAGYEHALNGSPNYGVDRAAFAQRLGAAAARNSSEDIFSDAVLASMLHQDPRYYRMGAGPGRNPARRVLHAITSTFISQTDSGRTIPNYSLLGGNLAGSFLTRTYYPPLNRSNKEVFKTFGGSLGGSALDFSINEFLAETLNVFHHDSH